MDVSDLGPEQANAVRVIASIFGDVDNLAVRTIKGNHKTRKAKEIQHTAFHYNSEMLTLWTFKSGGPDLKFELKNFLNPVDGLKIRILSPTYKVQT